MSPWLRWGAALVMLAGVAWQVGASAQVLAHQALRPAPLPLAGSLLGLGLFLLLGCEAWRRIIGALGHDLAYRDAFRILFLSNLGKYLPLSVWNLVGRVVLCERAGIPKLATTVSLLLETACQVVAALLVGLMVLPAYGHARPEWLAAAVVAIALGMHPRVLNGWLGLARRVSGREVPAIPFGYGFVLAMLGFYTFNWLLLGGAFALLGQAIATAPLGLGQLALLTGAFGVAWNAGVFAIVFPAGLGVREATLALILAGHFPPGWPAVLALTARVWFTLGEVAAFFMAAWLGRAEASLETRAL